MNHNIHDLEQGSDEWAAHRAKCNNASDLASARNESPHKSRSDLIAEIATGVTGEINEFTQRRFDDGHRFESLARRLAENIIGEDLYPITVSKSVDGLTRPLSASLDGSTANDNINFEHKSMNKKLSESLDCGVIPEQYHPQMEQGMMINGAEKTLFMASKWDDGGALLEENHLWYESNAKLRETIVPTWAHIEDEVENYQRAEPVVEYIGKAPESLPSLRIEVTGMVTESNMVEFKEHSLAVINSINTDLETDQDFENAKKTVKWLGGVEEKLCAAKKHALSQTASIDDLFRTIDDIHDEARKTRLNLNKTVTVKEKSRKEEIIIGAKLAFSSYFKSLNDGFGYPYMPELSSDFPGVCKGLKTMASRQNAVNAELVRVKIEADKVAEKIKSNLITLRDLAADYKFLFSDIQQIITKNNDDLTALVKMRIAEHKEAEEARLQAERDRIRLEEEQRAKENQERIAEHAKIESDRLQRDADKIREEEQQSEVPDQKNIASEPGQSLSDAQCQASPGIDKPDAEKEITDSLIHNGLGKQTAVKVAKLLTSGLVARINIV